MAGQNFNPNSFFGKGKACPNCSGRKWVQTGDVVGTVGEICPICQGTGAQKVPMPNNYDATQQGPFPAMNQSLANNHTDKTMDSEEILDDLWDDTPDYILP